jgi:hypothetical protein
MLSALGDVFPTGVARKLVRQVVGSDLPWVICLVLSETLGLQTKGNKSSARRDPASRIGLHE